MDRGAVLMVHQFEHAIRQARGAVGLTRVFWESQCQNLSDQLKTKYGIDARYDLSEGGE